MKLYSATWIVFLVSVFCAGPSRVAVQVQVYEAISEDACRQAADSLDGNCEFMSVQEALERARQIESAQSLTIEGAGQCREAGI